MSQSIFDKLNLRPQERRLVVIVGLIIFVLLNMWFVWPYFDDWGRVRGEIARANGRTLGIHEHAHRAFSGFRRFANMADHPPHPIVR